MLKRVAIRYRQAMVNGAQDLSDEIALEVPMLFERWQEGVDYEYGDRRCYNGVLYKCLQSHKSQSDWTPDITDALWTEVSVEEFPEWKQPQGSHDAYRLGAKVSHNGKHWISTIDYNIYEPSIAGWDEV